MADKEIDLNSIKNNPDFSKLSSFRKQKILVRASLKDTKINPQLAHGLLIEITKRLDDGINIEDVRLQLTSIINNIIDTLNK